MTDDDKSADIEDIAEDAVNELLGMYGYEGVSKNELKSSLKTRDFSFPKSYHPYLHIPMNGLLAASTSTGTLASKSKQTAANKKQKSKAPNSSISRSMIGKNLDVCQWCKKDRIEIVETLQSPTESAIQCNGKLKFCSTVCVNAYKLEIIRRETEACLVKNIDPPSSDDETSKTPPKPEPVALVQEKHDLIVDHADTSDLWSSAMGAAKRACKMSESKVHEKKCQHSKSTKQPRSKRRSAPPRPHPYYALNKKYWMTIRGSSEEMQKDDNSNATIVQETLSRPKSQPVSKQDDCKSHKSDDTVTRNGTPTSGVDRAVSIDRSPVSKIDMERPAVDTPIASASLTTLLSALPINLVWIPIPIPIPIPVPIPIPFSNGPIIKREYQDIDYD